jgi:thymidylate synthase (FAD)
VTEDDTTQPLGFKEVPAHYAGERETVDKMRDACAGDYEFAVACDMMALKYRDRSGRKTQGDAGKELWWAQMAAHVRGQGEDPRAYRGPSHAPYERPRRDSLVLDSGFLRDVEAWGHGDSADLEAGIIEAARQSTAGSFRGWERDSRLLKYLYTNKHSTPFEFAGLTIEVKAPIFVFRQWHRHRTQSYNEVSARYVEIPSDFYIPTVYRLMADGGANKQAQGTGAKLDEVAASAFQRKILCRYEELDADYKAAIQDGVPKELARLMMGVGQYSQMRATANLRNWLGFLTLRHDPHAQWEIRQYAIALHGVLSARFPQTMALWDGGTP